MDNATIESKKWSKVEKYQEKFKSRQEWDVDQLSIDILQDDNKIKLPRMQEKHEEEVEISGRDRGRIQLDRFEEGKGPGGTIDDKSSFGTDPSMRDYDYHLDADGEPIKVHMKQQDEDAVGAGLVTGDLHKYNQPLNKLEEYEDLEEGH